MFHLETYAEDSEWLRHKEHSFARRGVRREKSLATYVRPCACKGFLFGMIDNFKKEVQRDE